MKCKSLLLGLLVANAVQAYEVDKTYHLTILHTNDHHGHFIANQRGEGGMAARKTLVDEIRAEVEAKGGAFLLLSAGDVNTGMPESDMLDAEPDFRGMRAIGYDAMAVGNHEFDNDLNVLKKQLEWAGFPFVSANFTYQGKPLVEPYIMLERSGLKIGILGLTTEDTAKLGNPEVMKEVKFTLPLDAANQILQNWETQEKPDVKIALTHLGYYHNGEHGTNAPGDVSLARALSKGAVDMIIGGHTHDTVCVHADGSFNDEYLPGDECQPDYRNGIWIMQAGEWGKYVGRADFIFKNGELTLKKYQLLPVNLKRTIKDGEQRRYELYAAEIKNDEGLNKLLQPYVEQGEQLLVQKVGSVDGVLDGERDHVRFFPTNLGRLIADANRERVRADLAVMNSGGIRASIEAGDVTYKQVLTVMPFSNALSVVELSGEELLAYLNVVAFKSIDSGAYAQYSSNLSMVVDRSKHELRNISIDGKALERDVRYRLVVPNYVAAGGDGYPLLTQHPTYVDSGFIDADVLKAYIEQYSPIKAESYIPTGQIQFID